MVHSIEGLTELSCCYLGLQQKSSVQPSIIQNEVLYLAQGWMNIKEELSLDVPTGMLSKMRLVPAVEANRSNTVTKITTNEIRDESVLFMYMYARPLNCTPCPSYLRNVMGFV